MAKKTYPPWQYFTAAAIALAFGVPMLVLPTSYLFGSIFTVMGVAVAAYGFVVRQRARATPAA